MTDKTDAVAAVDVIEANVASLRSDIVTNWPDGDPAPTPPPPPPPLPIPDATTNDWPYTLRFPGGGKRQVAQGDGLTINLAADEAAAFGMNVGSDAATLVTGPVGYSDGTKFFDDDIEPYYSGDGFFSFAADSTNEIIITEGIDRRTTFVVVVAAVVPAPVPIPPPPVLDEAPWTHRVRSNNLDASGNHLRLQRPEKASLSFALSNEHGAGFNFTAGPSQLTDPGTVAIGPVTFTYDADPSANYTDDMAAYYSGTALSGGEYFHLPSDSVQQIHITEGNGNITTFTITVGNPGGSVPVPTPTPTPSPNTGKALIGPWIMARWTEEMPLINIFKTGLARWHDGTSPGDPLLAENLVDPATGYPLPSTKKVSSAYYFDVSSNMADGTYVADVIGDATLSVGLSQSTRISPKRLEFTITGRQAMYLILDSVGPGGIQDVRIYRKSEEALLDAGKIYSPRWLAHHGKYDIIRTMDYQTANGIFVTRADEVRTKEMAFYGSGGGVYKQSLPLEVMFAAGVEAGTEIWFQVPGQLGYPWVWKDPQGLGGTGGDVGAMRDAARDNAPAILASPEWGKYCDDVVAAMETVGYPETRKVYISLDNEVWNYAGFGFRRHSEYASGIAQSRYPGLQWLFRHGYGMLMANMMMAMDAAFKRAGRNQLVEYVFETQAADAWNTKNVLKNAKISVEARGESWSYYAALSGVSPASYFGGPWDKQMSWAAWDTLIKADPVNAAKVRADYILNGSGNVVGNLNWLMIRFKGHAANAATYGVKMTGPYEGGSHDTHPTQIDGKFWSDYTWGPEGARVNIAVNDALIAAFPDIITTNYASIGAIGANAHPWIEGSYGATNPYALSWDKYTN